MTTPTDRQNHASDLDALQALGSLQPPAGMQERIAERVRQRQLNPVAQGLRKYSLEFWAGASIAVVAAVVILGIIALQAHRAASPLLATNVPPHTIVPTHATVNTQSIANSPRKVLHIYRAKQATEAPIPHTPPPQPLTEQERVLVALANTPSLVAGVAQTQIISEHGLGPNALFELDHEDLQPMLSESRLSQPQPQNLP